MPHQIPPPPTGFTARQSELDSLLQVHAAGTRIFTLSGDDGAGKSALAFALAARLAHRYPDGQLMLDMLAANRLPLPPAEAKRHVIHSLRPESPLPENETELRHRYQSVLDGKKLILLLEDAHSSHQVEPLIPPSTCLLLVTSRSGFSLPGIETCTLAALDSQHAISLFLAIEPRLESPSAFMGEGTGVRETSVSALAALCDHHPLALCLSASALAAHPTLPVSQFIHRFRETRTRLHLTAIAAALQLSYELLALDLQERLRFLSALPAPIDLSAAAAIWSVDQPTAHVSLSHLVAAGLLELDPATSYRLHNLVRDFAAARRSPDESYNISLRHAIHFLGVTRQADELYLQGGADRAAGLRLFDLNWAHIRQGQAWAATQPHTDPAAVSLCNEYPDAGSSILFQRLLPAGYIAWLEAALSAAHQMGSKIYQGSHLGALGIVHFNLGQIDKAIEFHQQALSIAREIGDRRGEGNRLGNLGNAYFSLNLFDEAVETYQGALAIARELGDRRSEAIDLGNLGDAYTRLDKPGKAIQYLQAALAISRQLCDRRAEGQHLGGLALLYTEQGEAVRAVPLAKASLDILVEGDWSANEIVKIEKLLARLRKQLGEAKFNAALSNPPQP